MDTVTLDGTAYVAVQSMTSDGVHTVKIREVATGDVVDVENLVEPGHGMLGFYSRSRFWTCEEDQAFCVQGAFAADGSWKTFQYDPVAATVTEVPAEESDLPENTRQVGALWSTNDRPPEGIEFLGRSKDGTILWRHGYEALLGPGASSDAGWDWTVDDGDRVLGTVSSEGDGNTADRSTEATVALDGATGLVLWRATGATTFCEPAGDHATTHLRCRVRAGTIEYTDAGPKQVGPTDISLEKFDPATGAVIWSAPLGDAPGALSVGREYTPSEHYQVFASGPGAVRVQLDDGTVTPVDADEVLACAVRPAFEFPSNADPASEDSTYHGEPTVDLCLADGTPATTTVTAQLLTDIGIDGGDGIRLLTIGGHLEAYRVP